MISVPMSGKMRDGQQLQRLARVYHIVLQYAGHITLICDDCLSQSNSVMI